MLPNIIISVLHNGLGQVAVTTDNVCGLCLTGVAAEGKLELNKPYAIYNPEDAKGLGITPEGTNKEAWRHISEYYATAGSGKLWVIVSAAALTLSQRVDTEQTVCPAKILLDKAGGEISVLGITWSPVAGYTGEKVNGLDGEVYKAMDNCKALAKSYEERMMPFVALVEGRAFSGEANDLKDLKTDANFRTAVILSSTRSDKSASVGQALGAIAAIPVQRKISRVKNGSLPVPDSGGYLSDGVLADGREGVLNTIHDKRYILYRTFPGKSGYYYNGDMTATAETDDLNGIARVRVMDKAVKIAYNTYVEELDDDVDITGTGELHPAVVSYLKKNIEQQVKGNMSGEISAFEAIIEGGQNILSGNPLIIQLSLIPKGYLNPIKITLGFTNPALSNQ